MLPRSCRPGGPRRSAPLRARGFDIDGDVAPSSLTESHDTEQRPRAVAEYDRQPDVARGERPQRLDEGAQADRNADLRDDGNEERTAGIARALQASRIAERDRDEETGDAEVPQQLDAER